MFHRLRISTSLRLIMLLATVLSAVIVLGGCSTQAGAGEAQSRQHFLDEDGWRAEYAEATSALELPPGTVFPERLETFGAKSFEVGTGVSQAQAYWIYAWEKEWLTQRNSDAARESKAFDVLKNDVPASDFMRKYLDEGGRTMYAEYVKKAELGDPSGFQQDVEANPAELNTSGK